MIYSLLSFLANPWFVSCWYSIGAIGAAWVLYDTLKVNTAVNPPLKAAWPIIVFFFSVIGIVLYLLTCRPSGIKGKEMKEKKKIHHQYVNNIYYKTMGSLIHCVGGDGLGIMTAMIIARFSGFSFWQEFWFEYAAGYAFGWFIFQFWAFRLHDNGVGQSLFKAFRAEFFSMFTVMLGMGFVMGRITPFVVGEQPLPNTFAFWGFASFGLLVGLITTIPTNYILVTIGWKHGMS